MSKSTHLIACAGDFVSLPARERGAEAQVTESIDAERSAGMMRSIR